MMFAAFVLFVGLCCLAIGASWALWSLLSIASVPAFLKVICVGLYLWIFGMALVAIIDRE
jgi:hypothetical protein